MMKHKSPLALLLGCALLAASPRSVCADVVLDWNSTLRAVAQHDGVNAVNSANPGWFTRSAAMMNGAIFDVVQAIHRTHQPFLVDTTATNVDLSAAVHHAAYSVLQSVYPGEAAILASDYDARMTFVADGAAKANGIALGNLIAQAYIDARAGDHADDQIPYTPGTDPGEWRPDPYHSGQQAWGPGWGAVSPFAIASTAPYIDALPPLPALDSQEYADAFNEVKAYGDVHSSVRTPQQEDLALFWAYDRATMGPPPVLFNGNVADIALQAGNTVQENARLFALTSVAMADAAIAAWDAKFSDNFWRPVTAIHEADADGNSATQQDVAWRPMGAPGDDPNSHLDDFTPPFPAYVSGHATMGGAVFKTLELFYGTNNFDEIDGIVGNNPTYQLTSQEFDSSGVAQMTREFSTFTQTGPLDVGLENSPEGENGTSRLYLGIHWIFDQRDGILLGNDIASFVAGNSFLVVPEPTGISAALLVIAGLALRRRRGAAAPPGSIVR